MEWERGESKDYRSLVHLISTLLSHEMAWHQRLGALVNFPNLKQYSGRLVG